VSVIVDYYYFHSSAVPDKSHCGICHDYFDKHFDPDSKPSDSIGDTLGHRNRCLVQLKFRSLEYLHLRPNRFRNSLNIVFLGSAG
jgi:hypothetical protein